VVWLILTLNIVTAIIAAKKRVLPYAILTLETIFLITGQAFQMQQDLTGASFTAYAFSRTTERGFQQALWYCMTVSAISFVLAVVSRGYRPPPPLHQEYRFTPSYLFYAILLACECSLATVLIFGVVGISAFLSSSRPGNQPGATLFIVLMSIGLFPLLLKLAFKGKVAKVDLLCFLIALAVTAGFSRLHVILYSFVLFVVIYYRRGWVKRPISFRMMLTFVFSGVLLTAFFVGFGALRDAQNFTHGSAKDLIQYNLDHPEKSLLSLTFTYRTGVEGMSGLAGAISESISNPSEVHRDYGAQVALDGISQLLPSFLKQLVSDQIVEIQDWYWYKKPAGNVSPGLETSFVSFGWWGVLVYSLLVFLLGWTLPMKILSFNPTPPLMLCLLMVIGCTPLAIRGKWSTCFAFSIAYCVILLAVWPLFANCFSRVTVQEGA
jgi:hypothetical protein